MTPDGRILRVLVVDDNRDTADSLAVLVRMWGHEVQAAYNDKVWQTTAFANAK